MLPASGTTELTSSRDGSSKPSRPRSRSRSSPRGFFAQGAIFVGPMILAVLSWELVARWIAHPNLLPAPSMVWEAGRELAETGQLVRDITVSLQRAAAGFALASLIGVSLGLVMGRIKLLSAVLEPILQMVRPIPAIAWVPFSILWFGVGEAPKVFVIAIGVFFPVWLNTYLGSRGMERTYDEVSRVFGVRGLEAFARVVFPATLPHIVAGLRVGLSLAFILLVAAELTGTSEGMGALISQSQLVFRTDRMVVGMVLLGITGALVDLLFARIVKRFAYWETR